MTRASTWIKALVLLNAALMQATCLQAAPAGPPGELAALISAAQGTYPAAQLTLMCVGVSQAGTAPDQSLALIQKIGAHCVRAENNWASLERVGMAGSYDWSITDNFWTTLCQAKIKPIMLVSYNNPLYAAGVLRPISGGVNITAYKNFAVAMANHYAGQCPGMALELFNEPSAVNWTTVPWSGASYAAMLAPVSAAIKAAQPHVAVYSGGIGVDWKAPSVWITQMVSAGLRFPAVDAYGLHPYFYDPPPSGTPVPEQLLIDSGRFARDAASTGQKKPIALTEYGFSTEGGLTKQAIYVARGMLSSIIGHYPLLVHYDLVDDGTDESQAYNGYGLFRNPGYKVPYEIKPSAIAYSAITSAMANAKTFTIAFDALNSAPSISFDKAAGKTLVIWTYDASSSKSYERKIGRFKQVTCKDVFGKTYACQYAGETLSMTLSEPRGPVVVTALQ